MVDYDGTLIYMGLADAQKFFAIGDQVTGIEVRVQDPYAAPEVANLLQSQLGIPYTARDWTKINSNIFVALKLEKFVYSLGDLADRVSGCVQYHCDANYGGNGKTQRYCRAQVDWGNEQIHQSDLYFQRLRYRCSGCALGNTTWLCCVLDDAGRLHSCAVAP